MEEQVSTEMTSTITYHLRLSKTFPHSGLATICKICTKQVEKGEPVLFVLKKYTRGGFKKNVIVHERCFNEQG